MAKSGELTARTSNDGSAAAICSCSMSCTPESTAAAPALFVSWLVDADASHGLARLLDLPRDRWSGLPAGCYALASEHEEHQVAGEWLRFLTEAWCRQGRAIKGMVARIET